MLYPERCALCGCVLGRGEKRLCVLCRNREIRLPRGGSFGTTEGLDGAFAPYRYNGQVREALLEMKYRGRAEYASFYGAAIWRYGRDILSGWNIQAVIPVPVHPSRMVRRGYNQAELLAERVAGSAKIPMPAKAVIRVRNTKPQNALDEEGRRKNVRNAFRCRQNLPQRVLIVDDIITTGATAAAMALELRKHGARKVFCAAAAIAEEHLFTNREIC